MFTLVVFLHAELAPECASAYYRYGSALLYQAQDNADVFGGPLRGNGHGADDDKENDEAEGEADAEAKGKGKKPAENQDAGPSNVHEKVASDHQTHEPESDLQLAWENLETARAIWARDAKSNAVELASKSI